MRIGLRPRTAATRRRISLPRAPLGQGYPTRCFRKFYAQSCQERRQYFVYCHGLASVLEPRGKHHAGSRAARSLTMVQEALPAPMIMPVEVPNRGPGQPGALPQYSGARGGALRECLGATPRVDNAAHPSLLGRPCEVPGPSKLLLSPPRTCDPCRGPSRKRSHSLPWQRGAYWDLQCPRAPIGGQARVPGPHPVCGQTSNVIAGRFHWAIQFFPMKPVAPVRRTRWTC